MRYLLTLPLCLFLIMSLLLWKGITVEHRELPAILIEPSSQSLVRIPMVDSKKEANYGGARDTYAFTNASDRALFTKIINEVRCIVCPNQKLSDSMAPLAVDMRNEIYQKILLHKSESELIAFVTTRYGESALYQPPLQWNTALLWFGPFIAFLLGIFVFTKHTKH